MLIAFRTSRTPACVAEYEKFAECLTQIYSKPQRTPERFPIGLDWFAQRTVFTTPLLTEVNKRRNTNQFTKEKPPCQRVGVRGSANHIAKRTIGKPSEVQRREP
jgi:hypothetical protein